MSSDISPTDTMGCGTRVMEREARNLLRLRLQYMLNGYMPLPSYGKAKPIFNWKDVDVNTDLLHKYSRSRKLTTTCVRLVPPLAVADIDVNDPIAEDIRDLFFQVAGDGPQLVRCGAGFKRAIFAQCEEPFTRRATRRFLRPGETIKVVENERDHIVTADGTVVKGGGQHIELFGGKSARYFGAAGPHSHHGDGTVAVEYGWEGRSPENTPLKDLPIVSEQQWCEFLDRCEALLQGRGWTVITHARMYGDGEHKSGANPRASSKCLAEALAVIPASDGYEEWNKMGMAIYRATAGSAAGLAAWDMWSRKAHNYGGTYEKWVDYEKSPPKMLGAGTIFHLAELADPMWRRRSEEALYREMRDRAYFGGAATAHNLRKPGNDRGQ